MNNYEAGGIAAELPGIQRILDLVESELDRMIQLVNQELEPVAAPVITPHRLSSAVRRRHPGRPRTAAKTSKASDTQQWRKKIGAAQRRHWQNMTEKQRRDRIAAMKQGRLRQLRETAEIGGTQ